MKEREFLGSAYKSDDLVFARADGSPVDPLELRARGPRPHPQSGRHANHLAQPA